jgi:hypothetical protein
MFFFPQISQPRLVTYSNAAADQRIGFRYSSYRPPQPILPETITFKTCEGIPPNASGMHLVLLWSSQPEHPRKGYPSTYKKHQRLLKEVAEKLANAPIPFVDPLPIHDALLLFQPQNVLGRQYDIRNKGMKYISSKTLSPDELYKIGYIFSHKETLDEELIDNSINWTLEWIDHGKFSNAQISAFYPVCESVPILAKKMEHLCKRKEARLRKKEEATRKKSQAFTK